MGGCHIHWAHQRRTCQGEAEEASRGASCDLEAGNRTHFAGQKPRQGTFLAEGRGFARVEKQEKSWCVQELASPSARVASGSGSPTGKAVKRAGTGRSGGSNRRQHKGLCWLCLLLRLG